MAEDELRPQVNQNSVDITDLRALVSDLINNLVRPATELAVANRQRSEENSILIQNLLDEARADRIANRRAFDEQRQEMQIQWQEIRAQRQEMQAQQQVIQSMLVDLGITHSRLDELEAS
jgi:hypothetical protein